ncbi:P-loop containing nucleoside triphosphate hydrolase protein, partial [Patellaria atrata CBS 101060]
MSAPEPFEIITKSEEHELPQLFPGYHDMTSGKYTDIDVQITAKLREQYPDLIVTVVPGNNVSLLQFAAAGHATAELDTKTDSIIRWRGYVPSSNGHGGIGEAIFFAKYNYKWKDEYFILYSVVEGYITVQYILKEPRGHESTLSNSSVTDELIQTVGSWQFPPPPPSIYVYDNYWTRSTQLYEQVQKASWDKVILDPDMKKDLTDVSEKFFDSKEVYDEFGVPWKRGLIFYGPAGNGKTISIKALMHTLADRSPAVPTLYVKSAPYTWNIREVFALARLKAPCLLVLEDIDTIVTESTRSYFLNEVDGLENNDGILMVASTNHIDKLDPGLSKRPSRFDRKYLFPLPSKAERVQYSKFWRKKIKGKHAIDFPVKLCNAIASITDGFSFAYMQEAFVATLLVLARSHTKRRVIGFGSDEDDDEDDDEDLDKYEFWRVMKKQVEILREDMDN